jgi:hypothetical protein
VKHCVTVEPGSGWGDFMLIPNVHCPSAATTTGQGPAIPVISTTAVLALALTTQADGGDHTNDTDVDVATIRLESGDRDQRLAVDTE